MRWYQYSNFTGVRGPFCTFFHTLNNVLYFSFLSKLRLSLYYISNITLSACRLYFALTFKTRQLYFGTTCCKVVKVFAAKRIGCNSILQWCPVFRYEVRHKGHRAVLINVIAIMKLFFPFVLIYVRNCSKKRTIYYGYRLNRFITRQPYIFSRPPLKRIFSIPPTTTSQFVSVRTYKFHRPSVRCLLSSVNTYFVWRDISVFTVLGFGRNSVQIFIAWVCIAEKVFKVRGQ